jgi:hypothetical protein
MTSHQRPRDASRQDKYRILREADLRDYLAQLPGVAAQLGGSPATWSIGEVGDGNLNLVFIVRGGKGGIAVKQALPYVRLVGESWPLPLSRSHYEHLALTHQARLAPGLVPAVLHHDEALALIAMEFLDPHIIMRKGLVAGNCYPRFVEDITTFLARTLLPRRHCTRRGRRQCFTIGTLAPPDTRSRGPPVAIAIGSGRRSEASSAFALRHDALDLIEQFLPRNIDLGRPRRAENLAQRIGDHAEERNEQLARRAVGVVRRHLAFDQAKMAGARACEIENRVDRQRQHRTLDEPAAFAAKHTLRFRVFLEQKAIDQRRQILATLGGEFEAALDRIF